MIILTNHRSLKELMAQTIQTPEQQKYLTRLMGYDFIIQYCFGRSNVITNALSCTFDHSKGMVLTLLMPHFFFIDELKGELADNPEFNALRQDLQENPTNRPTLTYSDGLVLQNGRIWLPNKLNFIRLLLHKFHSTPTGSHMGVTKALARLQDNFTWNSIRQDVHDFVAQCLNCRHTKYVTRKPADCISTTFSYSAIGELITRFSLSNYRYIKETPQYWLLYIDSPKVFIWAFFHLNILPIKLPLLSWT